MNRDMIAMMRSALARGFEVLVLTNAMRPMRRFEAELAEIAARAWRRLMMRVSLDHHSRRCTRRSAARAAGTRRSTACAGWREHGFRLAVAGRRLAARARPRRAPAMPRCSTRSASSVDAGLVLFPTMDAAADVPEISEALLGHARRRRPTR